MAVEEGKDGQSAAKCRALREAPSAELRLNIIAAFSALTA